MPITNASIFLTALRSHRLLLPEQFDALAKEKIPASAADLARLLVQRGWLTPYQSNELILDRGERLLMGSYVLLESLGEGGMGQVFKARNWKLGQIVALKLIRKERLANPNAVRRFRREIYAAAKLDHPNIVRALDADELDGAHYFVMEFVEGIDLHKLVKKQGLLDVPRACDYVRQAALGLQHAYERGLVHRDIKPHNLLVCSGQSAVGSKTAETSPSLPAANCPLPTVKILDMGLARFDTDSREHSTTMTQEGMVVGTPDYLAPEQAFDSHNVDIRADLYSLGCTLFFLLAGKAPFSGGTFVEKMLKHQQQAPPPLARYRGDVPAEIEAVMCKLLAKQKAERFQTPAELAAALSAAADGTAIQSAAVAPPPPMAPTANVFAELHTSAAPALTSVPRAAPVTAGGRGRIKIGMTVAAGAIAAVLLLVIIVRAFKGESNAPVAPHKSRKITEPAPELPTSLLAQAAAEERARQAGLKKRIAMEEVVQKKRAEAAAAALPALLGALAEPKVKFADAVKQVQMFKAKHGGTPEALQAAALLTKFPSPLDQLDPQKIPEDAKRAWQSLGTEMPPEIVAVIGKHQRRHWGGISHVIRSPDGRMLAAGGADGSVKLWDAVSLQELLNVRASNDYLTGLAFRPDGQIVAACSHHGGTNLWDTKTGKLLHRFSGHAGVTALAFSADGKLLATGGSGDHSIHLWDPDTGKLVHTFRGHTQWIMSLAFAIAGGRPALASGSRDGTVKLWDLDTRKEMRTLTRREGAGNHDWILAASPDGRYLIASLGGLRVFDLTTGLEGAQLPGHGSPVFGKDSREVMAFSGNDLKFWELPSGKEIRCLKNVRAAGAALFPDGKRVVSGGNDGCVRLWDVDTGNEIDQPPNQDAPCVSVAFSPDDELLAIRSVGATKAHNVSMWETGAGQTRFRILGKSDGPQTDNTSAMAFAPDGKTFVTGEINGVKVRDLASGKTLSNLGPLGNVVTNLCFSPDGRLLAAAGGHIGNQAVPGNVKVWNVATGREHGAVVEHATPVYSVTFSPSGSRVASMSYDGVVKLWYEDDSTLLDQFQGPIGLWVSAAFLPDRNALAVGAPGGAAKVIDLASGQDTPLAKGAAAIWPGQFTADGKSIINAVNDRVVVWDAATGKRRRELQLPGHVHGVALSADGRHMATANGNGTVYILRLAAPPAK